VGYLSFVGLNGSSWKLVNFCKPTGAHRSSVNFREPKVATDGSESVSVSRPRRPQKLLNFSHLKWHRLPAKLNLTPPLSTSRAPPSHTPLHRPHRPPPGCLTAPVTSVGPPAPPPDPAARPPPSRSSRAAARLHWPSRDACHWHHHRPYPRLPLLSDRPLLAVHRPTSLPAGTPAHTPPLSGAGIAVGRPYHLGIAAGRRRCPVTGALCHPLS
jgi:hypothetical protein